MMIRKVFAFLLAPLIAVLMLTGYDIFLGGSVDAWQVYAVFVYALAIVLGLPLLILYHLLRVEHFTFFVFGGVVSAIVGLSYVIGINPFDSTTLLTWLSMLQEFWFVLLAGGCAGGTYVLISGRTPNKPNNYAPAAPDAASRVICNHFSGR